MKISLFVVKDKPLFILTSRHTTRCSVIFTWGGSSPQAPKVFKTFSKEIVWKIFLLRKMNALSWAQAPPQVKITLTRWGDRESGYKFAVRDILSKTRFKTTFWRHNLSQENKKYQKKSSLYETILSNIDKNKKNKA